jgi:hypothetical protein
MRWLLVAAALLAWLFYESRLHAYCVAKNEADDSAIFTVLHSAACNQLRGNFALFGLDCHKARLELDDRVRDLRVWQCHTGEHFLLGSSLRLGGAGVLLVALAFKAWRQKQAHQERKHTVNQQMRLLREMAPAFQKAALDPNYYGPKTSHKRRKGPLIEPVYD